MIYKAIPEIIYTVSGGTLNATQSLTVSVWLDNSAECGRRTYEDRSDAAGSGAGFHTEPTT